MPVNLPPPGLRVTYLAPKVDESPYHNPVFQKDKTILLYCASGGRSALSGQTLQNLGYKAVYNIGGFKELTEAALETELA